MLGRSEHMITYPDGSEAQVGDRLNLSRGVDTGVVIDVVDSLEKADTWGTDETGLMIESVATGLTFYPARSLHEGEIRLVSRIAS